VSEVLYQVKKPVANMLSTRLAPILQEKLEEHNVTREIGTADAGIIRIKNELAEVNDIMRSNIHKVLDRGDRLDDLQENTNELVSSSVMFQRQARKLKRKMWRERWMYYVAIFLCLAALSLIIWLMVRFRGS